MPPVVVAVAAGAASLTLGATVLTAIAIGVGTAVATDTFANALSPDFATETINPVAEQEISTSSNQPKKYIYGETVVGGQLCGYAKIEDGSDEYHLMVIKIAYHQCESVELYSIEGQTAEEVGSAVHAEFLLGAQTAANQLALDYANGWTTNHIGYDVTYGVLKIRIDAEVFPSGVNEIKFKVKGKRLYDPRLDSTVGGSGSHRIDDASTWEWSDNPILCGYDYVRFHGYRPLPARRLPIDWMAIAANYCDEQATYYDSDGIQQTEIRFTCNGVLTNAVKPADGLAEILKTCGGKVYRPNGKIYLKPAMYAGPATITVTPNDFSVQPVYQPHRAERALCNTVYCQYVEPELLYQVTDAPVVTNQTLVGDDGIVLDHPLALNMVNRSTQAQRLGNLHITRNRAGFIANGSLKGVRLDVVPGAVLRYIDAETGIDKEFIVEDFSFDSDERVTDVALIEDSEDIYPDDFEPSEQDLTPNTKLPDTTAIAQVSGLAANLTPNDSYRQGYLSWEHPIPNSVVNYVVLLTRAGDANWYQSFTPASPQQDFANLQVDSYVATVSAKNRFGKTSVGVPVPFNIGLPTTPTSSASVEILPGRVIITGPALPHENATYEWRYALAESGESYGTVLDGGRNTALTITNTPHEGTAYVWYSLVEGDLIDPNQVPLVIPNLVGADDVVIDGETLASLTLPTLPNNMLDTINGLYGDVAQLGQSIGTVGDSYDVVAAQVMGVADEQSAYLLDVLRLENEIGNQSVAAQIQAFQELGIGYEDMNGDWVQGALFARAFDEIRLNNAAGDSISVYSFFQALETQTGELSARIDFAIDVDGRLTGVFIEGSETESIITFASETLRIVNVSGVILQEWNATEGRIEQFFPLISYAKIVAPEIELTNQGNTIVMNPSGQYLLWCGPAGVTQNVANASLAFDANNTLHLRNFVARTSAGSVMISGDEIKGIYIDEVKVNKLKGDVGELEIVPISENADNAGQPTMYQQGTGFKVIGEGWQVNNNDYDSPRKMKMDAISIVIDSRDGERMLEVHFALQVKAIGGSWADTDTSIVGLEQTPPGRSLFTWSSGVLQSTVPANTVRQFRLLAQLRVTQSWKGPTDTSGDVRFFPTSKYIGVTTFMVEDGHITVI